MMYVLLGEVDINLLLTLASLLIAVFLTRYVIVYKYLRRLKYTNIKSENAHKRMSRHLLRRRNCGKPIDIFPEMKCVR